MVSFRATGKRVIHVSNARNKAKVCQCFAYATLAFRSSTFSQSMMAQIKGTIPVLKWISIIKLDNVSYVAFLCTITGKNGDRAYIREYRIRFHQTPNVYFLVHKLEIRTSFVDSVTSQIIKPDIRHTQLYHSKLKTLLKKYMLHIWKTLKKSAFHFNTFCVHETTSYTYSISLEQHRRAY